MIDLLDVLRPIQYQGALTETLEAQRAAGSFQLESDEISVCRCQCNQVKATSREEGKEKVTPKGLRRNLETGTDL